MNSSECVHVGCIQIYLIFIPTCRDLPDFVSLVLVGEGVLPIVLPRHTNTPDEYSILRSHSSNEKLQVPIGLREDYAA